LVELVVSLVIVATLTAIAIPSVMNSLRAYQLNDAAARVSDMLKFTRFEAVRKNTQVNCLLRQVAGGYWAVGEDKNVDGTIDPNDPQVVLTGFATLLPANGPPTTPILTALGVGALTTLSGVPGSVTFDARGAVRTGIGGTITANVFIIYVGNASQPQYGYRAVLVLPAGGTQVWTAPPGGTWFRIS
jgi:type II secretory pathway pseudopilin PulG